MEMTLKQIADSFGVDKQRVYRAVKQNHITEARQSGQTKLYDEAAQERIASVLSEGVPRQEKQIEPHQSELLETVLKQLEVKDQQIAALQSQVSQLTSALESTSESLKAAQMLHAGTLQQQLEQPKSAAEEEQEHKSWFRKWFG